MILLALATAAVAGQVRVMVQVIEVPHAALTKWTGTGKLTGRELHDRAMKLAATGEAEIVDTHVVIARSGEKAEIESYAEMISPSIYEFVGCAFALPMLPPEPVKEKKPEHRSRRAFDMTFDSFETRNIGNTLEIEPMVGDEGGAIELRLALKLAGRDALTTWIEFVDQWGDASIRTPEYRKQSMVGSLILLPGTFELFNVFTPKPAAVPAATTRQLVFVRCDVLPLPR